ncbi:unnamed protein product [Didymodactylos carnosus]|uniref:Uncharacterized protein n=1 Tax=Didymodactylos carnosus TaxID=1234261 RepID=A0A814R0X0_9BILA|nr:unnamed protein product [Didymodactylos carnosus]CAF1127040.1 unnamed protein product [Didymodactylos carnosus]CAF3814155.1 unnamed protein product [Didymodactylos carnosus]CAF3890612.1 unnamed protein product [Didymodactylos carnosus]
MLGVIPILAISFAAAAGALIVGGIGLAVSSKVGSAYGKAVGQMYDNGQWATGNGYQYYQQDPYYGQNVYYTPAHRRHHHHRSGYYY